MGITSKLVFRVTGGGITCNPLFVIKDDINTLVKSLFCNMWKQPVWL